MPAARQRCPRRNSNERIGNQALKSVHSTITPPNPHDGNSNRPQAPTGGVFNFVIVPFAADKKIFKLFPLTTSSAMCWTIYLNKFGLGKTLEFGNVSLRYFHLAYFTFVKSGGNAVDT